MTIQKYCYKASSNICDAPSSHFSNEHSALLMTISLCLPINLCPFLNWHIFRSDDARMQCDAEQNVYNKRSERRLIESSWEFERRLRLLIPLLLTSNFGIV